MALWRLDHEIRGRVVVTRANRFQNRADNRTIKTPPKKLRTSRTSARRGGSYGLTIIIRRDSVNYTRKTRASNRQKSMRQQYKWKEEIYGYLGDFESKRRTTSACMFHIPLQIDIQKFKNQVKFLISMDDVQKPIEDKQ